MLGLAFGLMKPPIHGRALIRLESASVIHEEFTSTQGDAVSTNKNKNDGHREGAVKGRSQFQTPSGNAAKRDTKTGRIIDVKSDKKPFEGVRPEK